MIPELLSTIRASPLSTLAITATLYFLLTTIHSWYRLRHFPGPLLARFSSLWILHACLSGQQAQRIYETRKKYGSVVRIGPNDLITDDVDLIRRMNGARSTYKRSSWYWALKMDPYGAGLFSTLDPHPHDKLKAQLSFGYGGKEVPTLEEDIDEQLAAFVALIRRKYISDGKNLRPFDMAKGAQYFTLDALTKIAYGKEFGFLETDTDVYGYVRGAEQMVPVLVALAELPTLAKVLMSPSVLKVLGPKETDAEGPGRMLGLAKEVVGARFDPKSTVADTRQDMLASFIRHGVPQRQCEIEVPFQIIAGSDTTATAIRATMLYLCSSRHAYIALQQEIDAAVGDGRVSNPVGADEGKNLPYLQAVIYEGLRMQIPFSGRLAKEVPEGGETINGIYVPAGTRIGQDTLALQRNPEVFGQDVDMFRPERWLEVDEVGRDRMVKTTEMVFGYGRWGCSGKPVAFIELNKVYIELMRRFDFELIDPKKPLRESNINMFFQSDMWMKITERFPGREI